MIEESRSSEIEKVIYMSAKNLGVFCRLFVIVCTMCSIVACNNDIKKTSDIYADFSNFIDSTRSLAVVSTDSALNYIDKAQTLGAVSMDSVHWGRALVYSHTFDLEKMSLELHSIVDSTGIDKSSSLYLSALARLAEVCTFQNRSQEAIMYNTIGDSIAYVVGDRKMQAAFHYNMGVCLVQKDNELGLKYLKESVDMFEALKDTTTWNEMMHVNLYLCNVYVMQHQYKDAIKVGEDLQSFIDNVVSAKEINKIDAGGTIRSNLCGLLCVSYAEEGQMLDAGMQYAKCQQYSSQSPTTPLLLANCLVSMRRTDEAIEALEKLHKSYRENGDTVSCDYADILSSLRSCYAEKKMYEKALDYAEAEIAVRNEVFSEEMSSSVTEWEIRYKSRESESALRDSYLEKRISRLVIVILIGVLFVAIVFLVMTVRHSKGMNAKNKALAIQMNRDMVEKDKESEAAGGTSKGASKEEKVEDIPQEAIEQIHIFVEALLSKKLFCDSSFQRDALIAELELNKRLVTRYFEMVMGKSFSKFLAVTRVEYAADQIRLCPNYTIEAIAIDSGISSRATFYRLFSEYFGISPTEYRKQCLSLSKE